MKSRAIKNVGARLILNNDEAKWLKSLMQNPIGCSPDEEENDDKQIRAAFWKALKDI